MRNNFYSIYDLLPNSFATQSRYFENAYLDLEYREKMSVYIIGDITSGGPAQMNWENVPNIKPVAKKPIS